MQMGYVGAFSDWAKDSVYLLNYFLSPVAMTSHVDTSSDNS